MSTGFTSRSRWLLVTIPVLLSFIAVGARLVQFHVIDRAQRLGAIADARDAVLVRKARRGDIVDVRGDLLATSHSEDTLAVDPWACPWALVAFLQSNPDLSGLRATLPPAVDLRPALVELLGKQPDDRLRQVAELAGLLGLKPDDLKREAKEQKLPARAHVLQVEAAKRAAVAGILNLAPADLDRWFVPRLRQPPPEELAAGRMPPGYFPDRWVKVRDGIDEKVLVKIAEAVRRISEENAPPAAHPIAPVPEDKNADLSVSLPRGFVFQRDWVRDYPHGQLASHLIGYVNKQGEPGQGLEQWADLYLRGADGWTESEKDGKKHELAQFRTREVPASNGYSVVLSLDAAVQRMVEQELQAIAEKFQPKQATIVVSDPRTGFILALANYPTFDPSSYQLVPHNEQGRLQNIAATDIYEPGSVFKIVASSGALEDGLVTPSSSFDCTLAKIDYRGSVRNLPRDDHVFDHPLSVAEILSRSSNKGAVQLAMRLGDQRFYDYVRAFGFGQLTGLPGVGHEEKGLMAPPDKWDGLTITRMPMGQSVSVTVLQMHQAMGVIADGGLLLQPQMIAEIRDPSGATAWRFDRSVVRSVISPRTARTMAQLLMGVAAKEGTAPEAEIPGFEVAGKTGTTQKLELFLLPNGRTEPRYSEHHHVGSFVGFLPASHPEIAISVIVGDADAHTPGGVAYGHMVAAPSFHRLAQKLISYLEIKPSAVTAGSSSLAVGTRSP